MSVSSKRLHGSRILSGVENWLSRVLQEAQILSGVENGASRGLHGFQRLSERSFLKDGEFLLKKEMHP